MLTLLNNIFETNKTNISEIWPNLEVYFHGGVNFNPYKKFKNILLITLNFMKHIMLQRLLQYGIKMTFSNEALLNGLIMESTMSLLK